MPANSCDNAILWRDFTLRPWTSIMSMDTHWRPCSTAFFYTSQARGQRYRDHPQGLGRENEQGSPSESRLEYPCSVAELGPSSDCRPPQHRFFVRLRDLCCSPASWTLQCGSRCTRRSSYDTRINMVTVDHVLVFTGIKSRQLFRHVTKYEIARQYMLLSPPDYVALHSAVAMLPSSPKLVGISTTFTFGSPQPLQRPATSGPLLCSPVL